MGIHIMHGERTWVAMLILWVTLITGCLVVSWIGWNYTTKPSTTFPLVSLNAQNATIPHDILKELAPYTHVDPGHRVYAEVDKQDYHLFKEHMRGIANQRGWIFQYVDWVGDITEFRMVLPTNRLSDLHGLEDDSTRWMLDNIGVAQQTPSIAPSYTGVVFEIKRTYEFWHVMMFLLMVGTMLGGSAALIKFLTVVWSGLDRYVFNSKL